MTGPNPQTLVSAAEIADLAGVTRAAVAQWRQKEGFPDAVGGTENRPLFDLAEVTKWVAANTSKSVRQDSAKRAVWAAAEALRGISDADKVATLVNGMLADKLAAKQSPEVSRRLADVVGQAEDAADRYVEFNHWLADNGPEQLAGVKIERIPASGRVQMARALDAISNVETSDWLGLSDELLSKTSRWAGGRNPLIGTVTSPTSTLVAALANSRHPRSVYDPACGIGQILLNIHADDRVGRTGTTAAVALAKQRTFLAGIRVDLKPANVLELDPDPDLRVDVVVSEPPLMQAWRNDAAYSDPRWRYGVPPARSADFLWIQNAIYHLNDDGRAYILTGVNAAFSSDKSSTAIRQELVLNGCVEAVVLLPGGMAPYTPVNLLLWVLRRDSKSTDVLFVDASNKMVDELDDLADWLSLELGGDEPVPHVRIATRDAAKGTASLLPTQHIATNVDSGEISRRFHDSLDKLMSARSSLARLEDDVTAPLGLQHARLVTVGELAADRRSKFFNGRLKRDELESLPTIGVHASSLSSGPPQKVDLEAAGDEYATVEGHMLTEPGDVLFTTMSKIRAVVDEHGGHVLGTGVSALRLHSHIADPRYVASALTGSWNQAKQVGATITRANPKTLEIPLLPVESQQQVVAWLERASDIGAIGSAVAEAAEQATSSLFEAIRYDARL